MLHVCPVRLYEFVRGWLRTAGDHVRHHCQVQSGSGKFRSKLAAARPALILQAVVHGSCRDRRLPDGYCDLIQTPGHVACCIHVIDVRAPVTIGEDIAGLIELNA